MSCSCNINLPVALRRYASLRLQHWLLHSTAKITLLRLFTCVDLPDIIYFSCRGQSQLKKNTILWHDNNKYSQAVDHKKAELIYIEVTLRAVVSLPIFHLQYRLEQFYCYYCINNLGRTLPSYVIASVLKYCITFLLNYFLFIITRPQHINMIVPFVNKFKCFFIWLLWNLSLHFPLVH